MLENDGTKLVQHILPCDISLHYHDAQFPTAVCRLLLVRFAALRCQHHRCVSSVAAVKRLNHWHRMWRNHRRGRSFWQHPKGYWFPQGISAGVILVLLWFWYMVYYESESYSIEDVSNIGALIGIVLGFALLGIEIYRFYKKKAEWVGKRRGFSIFSLVITIAFIVLMGWTLLTN